MDLYWQQVVENILGVGRVGGTTKTTLKMPRSKKPDAKSLVKPSATPDMRIAMMTGKNETSQLLPKPPKKSQKKVKFQVNKSAAIKEMKNVSLTSDEGIDISDSPLSPTITSIPPTILRPQHPLKTSWTFWYSVGNKNLSWEQNQVKISTVSTIEQFWLLTSQLKPPSNIPPGHTYSVFRAGVAPDYEDVANMKGGRWMISCPRVEREDRLDTRWLEVLFMVVGEHMTEFSGLINGAEACVRKQGDRLEVWVKDVSMMRGVVEVGRRVKSKLGLDISKRIKFSLHKEDKEGVKGLRLSL